MTTTETIANAVVILFAPLGGCQHSSKFNLDILLLENQRSEELKNSFPEHGNHLDSAWLPHSRNNDLP